MSKYLSESVFNILMENAQKPVRTRGIGGNLSGVVESRNNKSINSMNKFRKPAVDIMQYNTENMFKTNLKGNKNRCRCCGGALVGGYGYNMVDKRGSALVGGYGYNMVDKRGSALVGGKKKKLNSGLQHYNEALKKLKNKGHSHKEAQAILKQIKEEYGKEYEKGGAMVGGNFWKDFGRGFVKGFTGTAKTLLPLLPLII